MQTQLGVKQVECGSPSYLASDGICLPFQMLRPSCSDSYNKVVTVTHWHTSYDLKDTSVEEESLLPSASGSCCGGCLGRFRVSTSFCMLERGERKEGRGKIEKRGE